MAGMKCTGKGICGIQENDIAVTIFFDPVLDSGKMGVIYGETGFFIYFTDQGIRDRLIGFDMSARKCNTSCMIFEDLVLYKYMITICNHAHVCQCNVFFSAHISYVRLLYVEMQSVLKYGRLLCH